MPSMVDFQDLGNYGREQRMSTPRSFICAACAPIILPRTWRLFKKVEVTFDVPSLSLHGTPRCQEHAGSTSVSNSTITSSGGFCWAGMLTDIGLHWRMRTKAQD